MEKGDEVELPERRRMTATPTEYLRRIWYDCITYDPGALRYLISVVGAERVLFGTDWPHQVHAVRESLAFTGALPADQRDAIRGTNALGLFRLVTQRERSGRGAARAGGRTSASPRRS